MYVCLYVCMYLSVCIYLYVCICMYVSVCMYLYVCICMYVSVCMYLYVCICMYVSVCMYLYVCMYVSVWNYIDQLVSLLAGEDRYDDHVLSFMFYRIPIDCAEFWIGATQRYIPPWSNGPKMTRRPTIHQALNSSSTTTSSASARTSWWKHWAFSGTTGHHGSHSLDSFFKWHFPVAFGHLGPWRFSEIVDFPIKNGDFPLLC